MDDDLGLLVTAATDAADDAGHHRDYRGRFVHVGRGLIYALAGVAIAVDKFADAIHPRTTDDN